MGTIPELFTYVNTYSYEYLSKVFMLASGADNDSSFHCIFSQKFIAHGTSEILHHTPTPAMSTKVIASASASSGEFAIFCLLSRITLLSERIS